MGQGQQRCSLKGRGCPSTQGASLGWHMNAAGGALALGTRVEAAGRTQEGQMQESVLWAI